MPQDNPPLLDKTMNTTKSTPRNLADVLASGLASIANNVKPDGGDISINVPGMSATNVQDGVSELKQSLDDKADVSQLLAILAPTTQLTSSHDMNSTDCGTYFQSGTSLPLNAPATAYNAYIFVVKARAWDRVQFWWCMNTKTLYIRQTVDWTNGSSSNWTAWKSVIDIN